MSWNDERVELLKKLWQDGLSASQIAAEMGSITRNAVIGKVHRLGLAGRAKAPVSPVQRARKAQPRQRTQIITGGSRGNTALAPRIITDTEPLYEAKVLTFHQPAIPIPESKRVSIMELRESACKWPLGDPMQPEFAYCGNDSDTGRPYCSYHATIAYQPADKRRR